MSEEPLSFMSLLDIHRDINKMYLRHLKALISLEWSESFELLNQFKDQIGRHAYLEEEYILPLYAERAGRVLGGDPDLFRAEHRRMIDFIHWLQDDFQSARMELSESNEREDALERVIEILEREFKLKHLIEHHDLREHNILYPMMDRLTTAEEKARLLKLSKGE